MRLFISSMGECTIIYKHYTTHKKKQRAYAVVHTLPNLALDFRMRPCYDGRIMRNFLFWFQIVVSILLIVAILLQQKGGGLGAAFGGDGQVYRSRRGIEKSLFIATIILTALFIGVALAGLFLI